MKNYLIPISVAFMALSLASFMVRGDLAAVAMFACAGILFGFLCWIDRNKQDDSQRVDAELTKLKMSIENIAIHMGLK